ncbi:MAG TPA: hypothetical protein VLX44_05065 [Xanthobacteraceae bacterium]|nr:hypothetical protein [Xanthobacteraceae bacterium]
MRSLLAPLLIGTCWLANPGLAHSKNGIPQCAAFQDKAYGALGFVVYAGADEPASRQEFSPTEVSRNGSLDFRICVPIVPADDGTRGAVNVKIQIYAVETPAAGQASRAAEYENNTDAYRAALKTFRENRNPDSYPNLDIADYQNYHGCKVRRPHAISSQFHIEVDGRRTDDDPFRQKFVFSRDVKPACEMPGVLVEFLGGFPSIGPSISIAAGRYDPSVDKIVRRRSVILKYDFRAEPAGNIQYVYYDLRRIAKDRCVRVEVNHVFDTHTFGSALAGVFCVASGD